MSGFEHIMPRRYVVDAVAAVLRAHGKPWMIENANISEHPRMDVAFETQEVLRRVHDRFSLSYLT
jgi:hypothetical protein